MNLIRREDMMARQMHLVEWWLVSAMDMAGTVSSTMDKIWQEISWVGLDTCINRSVSVFQNWYDRKVLLRNSGPFVLRFTGERSHICTIWQMGRLDQKSMEDTNTLLSLFVLAFWNMKCIHIWLISVLCPIWNNQPGCRSDGSCNALRTWRKIILFFSLI